MVRLRELGLHSRLWRGVCSSKHRLFCLFLLKYDPFWPIPSNLYLPHSSLFLTSGSSSQFHSPHLASPSYSSSTNYYAPYMFYFLLPFLASLYFLFPIRNHGVSFPKLSSMSASTFLALSLSFPTLCPLPFLNVFCLLPCLISLSCSLYYTFFLLPHQPLSCLPPRPFTHRIWKCYPIPTS